MVPHVTERQRHVIDRTCLALRAELWTHLEKLTELDPGDISHVAQQAEDTLRQCASELLEQKN